MPVRTFKDSKGRKRYAVEFEQRGSRIFRRLPAGATKEQAQQLETRLKHELIDQTILGKKPNVTLEHAINAWLVEAVTGRKSEKGTRSHAARVVACTDGRTLSGIGEVSSLLKIAPLAAGTINRRLCILKAVAKFAWRKGWTEENLSSRIQLLPEHNARHRYLLPLQVDALLGKAGSPEIEAFIAWAVYTGMRQGEILALGTEDILEDAIRIRDSKTGQPRVVPIVRQLHPYLAAIPFKSHKRTLYKGFERARDAAGLGNLTYHDLRHTTASMMINSGIPLYVVGRLLGHKSAQTTQRYAHLATETIREAMILTFEGKHGREKAA